MIGLFSGGDLVVHSKKWVFRELVKNENSTLTKTLKESTNIENNFQNNLYANNYHIYKSQDIVRYLLL